MSTAPIAEGDVVRVLARAGKIYPEQGLMTIRILLPNLDRPGGRPGYHQQVVAIASATRVPVEDLDEAIVPPR